MRFYRVEGKDEYGWRLVECDKDGQCVDVVGNWRETPADALWDLRQRLAANATVGELATAWEPTEARVKGR
jgi:hypothetical protein